MAVVLIMMYANYLRTICDTGRWSSAGDGRFKGLASGMGHRLMMARAVGTIPARSLRFRIHGTCQHRAGVFCLCHAAFHGAGGTAAGSATGRRFARSGLSLGQVEPDVVVVVGPVVVEVGTARVPRVVVPTATANDAVGVVWPPSESTPPMPTALCPKTQGCGASRYLGKRIIHLINPIGVVSVAASHEDCGIRRVKVMTEIPDSLTLSQRSGGRLLPRPWRCAGVSLRRGADRGFAGRRAGSCRRRNRWCRRARKCRGCRRGWRRG